MALTSNCEIIASLIKPESKLLNIGCGEGDLLCYLKNNKAVIGEGLELKQSMVSQALKKGVKAIKGDAEKELMSYADLSFDYAVLSPCLQGFCNPQTLIEQMLRVAKFAIVLVNNFAHYRNRFYLMLKGQVPVASPEQYGWYDQPDLRLCSIKDFDELCQEMGWGVSEVIYLATNSKDAKHLKVKRKFWANFLAHQAIFLINREQLAGLGETQLTFSKERELFLLEKVGGSTGFVSSQSKSERMRSW